MRVRLRLKHAMTPLRNHKAFTLLELLVVVLIIGVLAAVALPQYQMTVAKARFTELKVVTKYVAEFAQAYYLEHGTYEGATEEVRKDIPSTVSCYIWPDNYDAARCCKTISNVNTCLYVKRSSGEPSTCLVFDPDITSLAHKLCQQETKRSVKTQCAGEDYCGYAY